MFDESGVGIVEMGDPNRGPHRGQASTSVSNCQTRALGASIVLPTAARFTTEHTRRVSSC
jgi:hypothetical protein